MQRLTAEELQQARVAAAQLFQQIGLLMLKEAGVLTWEFHEKGLCGCAYPTRNHITCPKPTTRRRLYILAHECGHIALSHINSKPRHREEFEAEQYAHDALRRHNVPVPRKATENAKTYVASRIDLAIRMGRAQQIDRESVIWSETKHRMATKRALANKTVKLVYLGSRKS